MARVVHSGLDALVQGIAVGRHLVAELGVDGRREALGHAVVVFAQVRVVCAVRGGERSSASSPAGRGLDKSFVSDQALFSQGAEGNWLGHDSRKPDFKNIHP